LAKIAGRSVLNAYEARFLSGTRWASPALRRWKLAARSHVPRQKIYEVLDSLIEKGFAQVVSGGGKRSSSRPLNHPWPFPATWARRGESLQQELTEQARFAGGPWVEDLNVAYSEGQGGRGTLDYLRIVSEPGQTALAVPADAIRSAVRVPGGFPARRMPWIPWTNTW